MELVEIIAGITIHSSNQNVNGMARVKNDVVAQSLREFGNGRARSRIFFEIIFCFQFTRLSSLDYSQYVILISIPESIPLCLEQ